MAEKSDEKTRLDINAFACIFGDNDAEVTPVPIPNTVVKLCSADDTWREAARESRSSPEQKNTYSCKCFFVQFYSLVASYIALQFYLLRKWYCLRQLLANKIPLKPQVSIPLSLC